MKSYTLWGWIAVVMFVIASLSVARAHGVPEIVIEPAVVAAGGTITVTGSEMENGEKFTITLEGSQGSTPLGEATATGEPEAGFVVTFAISETTAPGLYTVRAATDDGGTATADLTITAPTTQASAGPAMAPAMPSAEAHVLDRTKSFGQIVLVLAVIALSTVGGFVLVRRQA